MRLQSVVVVWERICVLDFYLQALIVYNLVVAEIVDAQQIL